MINNGIMYALIALICAMLLSFSLTPLVRVLAYKIGALDIPKDNRRMHKKPIPLIGGLAIFLSFVLTCMFFCDLNRDMFLLLTGGLLMVILGTCDDMLKLNAWLKLAVQVAISAFVVIGGIKIEQINIGGNYITLGIWSIPLTILWITGLTNAVNLIDGLDGLSCGVSTISSISILCVVILQGDFASALVAIILVGACCGFLPFNRNPAKIFMGDTGALFLGYTLAVISVEGMFKMHAVISMLVPLFIFAFPIADTAFAIIRRMLSGKSPFAPDRGHLHHKLVDMGFTQKESVKILYSLCGILGLVAVFMCDNMFPQYKLVKSLAIIILALTIFIINLFVMKNPKSRMHSGLFEDEDHLIDKDGDVNKVDKEASVSDDGNEKK